MYKFSLVTLNDPTSFVTESYKLLRTNLNFKNIKNKYQVILCTSPGKAEGKTTTICNLAITLAQSDKRVLLIDADLRIPKVDAVFGLDIKQTGLSNMLVDDLPLETVVMRFTDFKYLEILTAGNKQVSPTELLNSEAFENLIIECKKKYDIILIDTPPVLFFADASIVAKVVNGVLLIVAAQETKKTMVVEAKKGLDKVGATIIGVVLTKVKFKKDPSYYKYRHDHA